MIKVGFTGTQIGLSPQQITWLTARLADLSPFEFHHGDCVGADYQAHWVARALGARVIGHPPDNPSKRAFCDFNEERAPLPYLDRNTEIVRETDLLLACPSGPEVMRSGTWATIRRARKFGHQREICLPDGTLTN